MSEEYVERYEEQEFTCPECGAHTFSSALDESDQKMKGHCHGRKNQPVEGRHGTSPHAPCGFVWLRADDAKYFKGTGLFRPRAADVP